MDPDILRLHDASRPGYDIYVDTAGYAVPNRIVKRAVGETNEVRSSWDTQCHIWASEYSLVCSHLANNSNIKFKMPHNRIDFILNDFIVHLVTKSMNCCY